MNQEQARLIGNWVVRISQITAYAMKYASRRVISSAAHSPNHAAVSILPLLLLLI